MTAILKCTCDDEYMDKKYGKGMRVHNGTAKGWRCAKCGKEKVKEKV